MNLVDSCAWLEYFSQGPNADFFAPAVEDTERLIVPTICILEVFKVVLREVGEDAALQAIAAMNEGHIVELDVTLATNAAKIGVDLGLPLADSVIVATARANHAVIWTQDSHFAKIGDVKYVKKKMRRDVVIQLFEASRVCGAGFPKLSQNSFFSRNDRRYAMEHVLQIARE
jgi:predicted nucleic acid-binding protein